MLPVSYVDVSAMLIHSGRGRWDCHSQFGKPAVDILQNLVLGGHSAGRFAGTINYYVMIGPLCQSAQSQLRGRRRKFSVPGLWWKFAAPRAPLNQIPCDPSKLFR